MKKTVYVFVFIVYTLILSCEKNDIVARVGNHVIKIQDVRAAIEDRRGIPQNDFGAVLELVHSLVDNKLMLISALQANLDKDSIVVETVNDFKDRQVYISIIQKKVVDKVITPQMLKRKYKQQSRHWHVRHIFFPLKQKRAERKAEIISELTALRSRLLRGESFDALARQFSKDSLSAGKGGDLGFLKWGDKKFGDAFYTAIQNLQEGQISDVIESEVGYHIVKVENIRLIKQEPFTDKVKQRLQRTFFRTKGPMLDSTYYNYVDELKADYKVEYVQENIDSLLTLIRKGIRNKMNPQQNPNGFFHTLSAEQQEMPLAIFKGGTFTVARMFKVYNTISPMRRPAFNSRTAIKEFLDRNVPRILITREGYKAGVDKKSEVREAVLREREKQLVQRAKAINVDERVDVTDSEMEMYYEENSFKYEKDARVDVLEIKTNDLKTAKLVAQKAREGEDFYELAKRYGVGGESAAEKIALGYIGAKGHGSVGRKAVQMRTGEVSDPIRTKENYSIIKVIGRKPGQETPFEQVKLRIKRELQRSERATLQEEWLQGLRETIPVFIYEKTLKREFGKTE